MRLVSIKPELLELYSTQDKEVLCKAGRPYVVVLKLLYKGRRQDFAVPLRSNIPAAAPKYQYFALPPRPSTRARNRHGLHYIKMFPVSKQYMLRYRTEGNAFATMIQRIIDDNTKRIVNDCQQYLDHYSTGERPPYSTDIDLLIALLQKK